MPGSLAADVALLGALRPAPASVRDVRKRLGWGADRAAAAMREWRARAELDAVLERELVEPADVAAGDDYPEGGVRDALEQALWSGGVTAPEYAPAVALARRYASLLDGTDGAIATLGRPFLAVLVQLRLTPGTRPAVPAVVGGEDDDDADELAQLRAERDSRAYRAAPLDPPSP